MLLVHNYEVDVINDLRDPAGLAVYDIIRPSNYKDANRFIHWCKANDVAYPGNEQ